MWIETSSTLEGCLLPILQIGLMTPGGALQAGIEIMFHNKERLRQWLSQWCMMFVLFTCVKSCINRKVVFLCVYTVEDVNILYVYVMSANVFIFICIS